MITVRIRLFGMLRSLGHGDHVELQLPAGSTITELREALATKLGAAVQSAAIADEQELLPKTTKLTQSCTLAALPPVCGG